MLGIFLKRGDVTFVTCFFFSSKATLQASFADARCLYGFNLFKAVIENSRCAAKLSKKPHMPTLMLFFITQDCKLDIRR